MQSLWLNRTIEITNPKHPHQGARGLVVTDPDDSHMIIVRLDDGTHASVYAGLTRLLTGPEPTGSHGPR